MGFDKSEIALKFEKGITELFESHSAQRVGDYIDTLKVTPEESARLISQYFAKQGRGLPWDKCERTTKAQNLREWFSKICL